MKYITKKIKHFVFVIVFTLQLTFVFAQDQVDIVTPKASPFQTGSTIEGIIQNSVNEVTGKVSLSVPVINIKAGRTGHNLSLGYNGQSAFEIAKNTNEYAPTSTVGLGWSLPTSRIIVDHKQTGTRDDDDFYLIDGSTNTKLICIKRGTNRNHSVWEFQAEKFRLWKIKFHFHNREDDYWSITKEDGVTYTFGDPNIYQGIPGNNKSREYTIRYNNWIGNSKNPTGTPHTIVWNIYKVEDQYGNNITYSYERLDQLIGGKRQTEASYLKKIKSSDGAYIAFEYANKNNTEYHEPHQENPEPDAYHERYEKKYLHSIKTYNNYNELSNTFNFQYIVQGINRSAKRYLTSIIETKDTGERLPSQKFEYHLSGPFKGGIKKITYPTGGSVTYTYKNQNIFFNGANRFNGPKPHIPSGYKYYSTLVKEKYSLFVVRTINPVSNGKYRFKFFRSTWNGQQWDTEEYTFPHLISDGRLENEKMKGFSAILEKDFYGFMFDTGNRADIYLFHLEKNGHTWKSYKHTGLSTDNSTPILMSGNEFAAIGTHQSGKIYTYYWKGDSWKYKRIDQGWGTYYYAGTNNFILSLNEDGGTDAINGGSYRDNYYFHYLDAEKKWQSKSWSTKAAAHIASIERQSYFYPSNAMAGFVADDNPEFFLRWGTNYELQFVDNVIGAYNDQIPMQTSSSGMFTLHNYFWKNIIKSARFNGSTWKTFTLPSSASYRAKPSYGMDIMTFQGHQRASEIRYQYYNPNIEEWELGTLGTYPSHMSHLKLSGITRDFIIAGNKVMRKSTFGTPYAPWLQIATLEHEGSSIRTDGLHHAFIGLYENSGSGSTASSQYKKGIFGYIDKKSGMFSTIDLGNKTGMGGSIKIGGYRPFMSPSAIWLTQYYGVQTINNQRVNPFLYRIINDEFNKPVSDIIIDELWIDNKNEDNQQRKIKYTLQNPNPSPDNSTVFYEKVTIENMGYGNSSNGAVQKFYNTGVSDIQLAGLLEETHIKNTQNELKQKTTSIWKKFIKPIASSQGVIDQSYYIRAQKETEDLFFENGSKISSVVTHAYYGNHNQTTGLLSQSTTKNSNGETEIISNTYAANTNNFSFLRDKNIIDSPLLSITKIDNEVVAISKNTWSLQNDKAYISEYATGTKEDKIRTNQKITKIDAKGNVIENSNGSGIYSTSIYGYKNTLQVASIKNASYDDVMEKLNINYAQLQNMDTPSLKNKLLTLYETLPDAIIKLVFYDKNGRVINQVDPRKEEVHFDYDAFGRLIHTSDNYENVLEKKEYNYGN